MAKFDASKTVVLITGANIGLGYAAARLLVQDNPKYHVIIGSRSLERGQAALEKLQDSVSNLHQNQLDVVEIDITKDDSITAAAAAIEKRYGRLDVLVNNAAIALSSDSGKWKSEELRLEYVTNCIGPAITTQTFVPLLRKSKDPRIIFVTSGMGSLRIASVNDNPYYFVQAAGYRSTKSALNMIMVETNKWLQGEGMKVWAVCPGWCATTFGNEDAEAKLKMGAKTPEQGATAITEVIEGKRDADVGKVTHNDEPGGTRAW
ncbi:NAD(P)-binding protein [Rhizodiscina lignyota]|uniref:NAD(P)-binding protein n=1 Tax=Rhizodiscina lignyota TaxID=1504668 RepID=A0A9P4I6E9_9PEZI|nr:NAD(P)-binding protein [Rhizodiscina lignyota]